MILSRIPDHSTLESGETTRKTRDASKVPRACDGCRSLKLRCVPTSNTGGICAVSAMRREPLENAFLMKQARTNDEGERMYVLGSWRRR